MWNCQKLVTSTIYKVLTIRIDRTNRNWHQTGAIVESLLLLALDRSTAEIVRERAFGGEADSVHCEGGFQP
jgi:hypothetical protein